MPRQQKSRKSVTSKGSAVGCRPLTPKLSEVQKVNLGHGMLHGLPKRWRISPREAATETTE